MIYVFVVVGINECFLFNLVIENLFKKPSLAVHINETLTFTIIAQANCLDVSISEIRLVGPVGVIKSSMMAVNGTSNQYYINVTFTPTAAQIVS